VNLDHSFFVAHLEQYQLLLCLNERPSAVFRLKAPLHGTRRGAS
jgi:hypothetical protein